MTLKQELAEELAALPKPAVVEPTWYTAGGPGSEIPSVFSTPDGKVVPPAQVYLRFRAPDGHATAAPYTNRATYLAKFFVWQGTWADWDAWSVAAAYEHKWHGFGPTWPGQTPAAPPTAKAPRPALSPSPAVPIPPLADHVSRSEP